MKTFLGLALTFSLSVNSFVFAAETPASTASAQSCHALKYDSYFVAQNLKGSLKALTPDVSHANFDQKYLLLRAELAMETIYLIADCSTGEFFHERLSALKADFNSTSPAVQVSNKDDVSHYEWDGKSWIKGDSEEKQDVKNDKASAEVAAATAAAQAPIAKASSTTSAPATPSASLASATANSSSTEAKVAPSTAATPAPPAQGLVEKYQKLFESFAVPVSTEKCAPLDANSYFRAQQNSKLISELNKHPNEPNFAGNKVLVRTETLFSSLYLIADCKTGKFTDEEISGDLLHRADSRLLVMKDSDTVPTLKVWNDNQYLNVPNPVAKEKPVIMNTLYGAKATALLNAVGNPKKNDVVRFENLKASAENSAELKTLFHDLSTENISSGTCHIPRSGSPTCDVETASK